LATEDMPVLTVSDLSAGYGAAKVLHGIDFSVARGEMLVVIGRNGVGKTTLIETICGLTTLQGGEIAFNGKRIEKLPPFRRNRLGIGWAPQEREVFASLTVAENLGIVYRGGPWNTEALYGLFPRLAERRRSYARLLSGGEQQMLVIARALATDPTLLLLDEPVEGLAPLIVQEMIAAINKMRRESALTIIMVEQKYDIALANSDRCIVIDHGAIVHSAVSAELLADAALLERLIGVAE
jgi:branched-chain amino acid transport system ATP-binding protein